MNNKEAERILQEYLERYRVRTYKELTLLMKNAETFQVYGESDAQYQIEVQAFWDNNLKHNIRVLGVIDDGGMRAFSPLGLDFIIAPDGTFVGE